MRPGVVVRAVSVLVITAATLVCAAPTARAEWAEWIADAELGAVYYDNINRSYFASDKRADTALAPSVSLGRYNQLTDSTRLRATADVEAALQSEFESLNYVRAGVTLAMQQKLSFGADAAWLKPRLFAAYTDVGEDTRDGWLYEAGVSAGQRLTPRLDGRIGYIYSSRDGREGEVSVAGIGTDVFDQKGHTLSIDAAYLLTGRLLLTGGYAFRSGDFDSSCTPDNVSDVLAWGGVDAITVDDAFTEDFCVYRVSGTTNSVSIDASYSLFGGHGSLNMGYQRNYGEADSVEYESSMVRVSLIYSY
jgi:hypothetical protein